MERVLGIGGIFFMRSPTLLWVWAAAFVVTALFAVVTLPVEFDASRRAMRMLDGSGILVGDEWEGVKSMLTAAALTYVAAALTAILTLLYYLSLARRSN